MMPPKAKRFKMECLVFHATFGNDYRKKHNELCHPDYLKAHRIVRYKVAGAIEHMNGLKCLMTFGPATDNCQYMQINVASKPGRNINS